MAIKFSSYSHWSSESNLPSFDISGGNEVIDQWRSPYDPTLWYLHNISSEGDRTTSRTTVAPYGKSILSNPNNHNYAQTISGPAVEGYDQGVRYDGFLRSGDYNTYKITRDASGLSGYYTPSITNGLIMGGSGSASNPRTDISTFYEELPRKNNSGLSNNVGGTAFNEDTWGFGVLDATSSTSHYQKHVNSQSGNFSQSATTKVLKYGRLYYQYDGGQSTESSTAGISGSLYMQFDLNTLRFRYGELSFSNGQSHNAYMMSMNYPEIWMQDARFKWSDTKSTLRESEIKIMDPSPVLKFNNAARGWTRWSITKPSAGITSSRYGLETIIDSSQWKPGLYDPNGESLFGTGGSWSNPPGGDTYGYIYMDSDAWLYGSASTDYYNDGGTGHAQAWGRNFCIGNGMMFHGKYGNHYTSQRNEGTFASIDGGMDAVGWGIIPYHAELDGRGQGPDEERSSSDSTGYLHTDYHPWHVMDYDKWFQYDHDHFPALPSPYEDQNRGDDIRIVRVCDFSKGCRMKTQFVGYDVDTAVKAFAVGNGRIYTMRTAYDNVLGSDNPNSFFFSHGLRPYPSSISGYTRGGARRSLEIMDMGGTTRKCHFAPNGGVLFNYGSIANTASSLSPQKDAFQFWAEMIKAGCGRLAVAAPHYRHEFDMMSSGNEEYGVVWLLTQDGQFIKTLSFRDENWGIVGNANGANELKFGTKIDIKNNLIFVLAPEFDMSQLSGYFKDTNYSSSEAAYYTWGGKGRMYIYSLDGELLAAFSPFNLGFRNTADYSKLFSFDDFLTDGVNLYLFDNCTKKLGDLNEHYVAGTLGVSEANETAAVGYSISAGAISKNTQVMHLKLPESITKYYDDISEMYRY